MTDNIAVMEGYDVPVIAECGQHTLCLLVRVDTDYDGVFRAWDTDGQEFIEVNGWLFTVEVDDERQSKAPNTV